MNTESPAPPTQPKERKSSRVATSPRKTKEKLHDAELDETLETLQSEEASQESSQAATSSSETSSESSKKKSKKKSKKREKARELLAYVGKGKANMLIETVKGTFSDHILKQLEEIQTGKRVNISKKYERFDQELYSEILKSLLRLPPRTRRRRYLIKYRHTERRSRGPG